MSFAAHMTPSILSWSSTETLGMGGRLTFMCVERGAQDKWIYLLFLALRRYWYVNLDFSSQTVVYRAPQRNMGFRKRMNFEIHFL